MTHGPYSQLIATKRWADRGLYDVVTQNFERLSSEEASIMLRIACFSDCPSTCGSVPRATSKRSCWWRAMTAATSASLLGKY